MASLTPDQIQALADLDAATERYRETESAHEASREEVHKRLVDVFVSGIGPSMAARRSPYQRNHVERIRKDAGLAPKS